MNILLFKIPLFGRIIRSIVVKKEGGPKESISLREWCNQKHNVDIGLYTYGSCFSGDFNTGGVVKIGRYCSFGPNIHYFGANHPMNMAVMSPYFYNKRFAGFDVKDVDREQLSIGNDVWVGANVNIAPRECGMSGESVQLQRDFSAATAGKQCSHSAKLCGTGS